MLDQGDLVAEITAPTSATAPLPLVLGADGTYSAAFVPTEEGSHTIRVVTRNASYKGTAYTTEASTTANVVVVPTIGISGNGDIGALESLRDGLSLSLHVMSSSARPEEIGVAITGLPGGRVEPSTLTIPVRGDSEMPITIASDSDLAPGDYDGAHLIFSVRPGVILAGADLPLHFTIVQGMLKLTPAIIDLGRIAPGPGQAEATITVVSTSARPERLQVTVEPAGVGVRIEPDLLDPNTSTKVRLIFDQPGASGAGTYTRTLRFTTERGSVPLSPTAVTVRWAVPSFLERWGLTLSVLALLLAGALGLLVARTPKMGGTLQPVAGPSGQPLPPPIYLHRARRRGLRRVLRIGSAKGSDALLTGGGVQAHHAEIRAERRSSSRPVGTGRNRRQVKTTAVVPVVYPAAGSTTLNNTPAPRSGAVLDPGKEVSFGEYRYRRQ